jgi:hypothetical protein
MGAEVHGPFGKGAATVEALRPNRLQVRDVIRLRQILFHLLLEDRLGFVGGRREGGLNRCIVVLARGLQRLVYPVGPQENGHVLEPMDDLEVGIGAPDFFLELAANLLRVRPDVAPSPATSRRRTISYSSLLSI